jgi:hypothetical protein
LRGLSLLDARRIVRELIHEDGRIDVRDVAAAQREKFALIARGGVLSLEPDVARFEQIAGLARLKQWIQLRQRVFVEGNAPKGLDPPRGVLLLGVQGCGKSLAAKACAGGFGVPLLRLDFAALYNKYHGETERNLREALKSAEAMAPCVLWCDEIEKGLARAGDLLGGEPDHATDRGMRGHAIATVVGVADRERDPFALPAIEATAAGDVGQLQVGVERDLRMREHAEHVRQHAELLLHRVETGTDRGGNGIAGQGGDVGHGLLRLGR